MSLCLKLPLKCHATTFIVLMWGLLCRLEVCRSFETDDVCSLIKQMWGSTGDPLNLRGRRAGIPCWGFICQY